jgi:DNA-binding SARP family transcriptional activator
MLEVKLLGQFDVRRDGAPIAISSRPEQSLFSYLILNAGTTHRREKLAGLLWPDSPEETARGNLRHELWRLRKALASGLASEQPYILADDISITFNSSADYWLDISILECGASARATTDDLVNLLAHYRGELLPGFYDDWAVLERGRLQAVFEQEVQRLLDSLKEEQRWTEVLDWGERWIALGQRPEPAYRALMIAYGALEDRSKIVSTFHRCAQALRDDLGVEPSELTCALYEQLIERSKPIVHPPYAILSPAPAAAELQSAGEPPRERAYSVPPFKGLEYFDEADADLFFGRELVTAKLVGRLREGHFLAIVGASGSGKSSIVRAGLIPALIYGTPYAPSGDGKQLADGSLPPADSTQWHIQLITPTAHPLEALARILTQRPESTFAYARVLDDLERGPHGLHLAVQRLVPDGRGLILIVDQFEELFTLCRDEFEREAFVDNLLTASSSQGAGAATVVLAVRADFYAHCLQYDDLRQALPISRKTLGR